MKIRYEPNNPNIKIMVDGKLIDDGHLIIYSNSLGDEYLKSVTVHCPAGSHAECFVHGNQYFSFYGDGTSEYNFELDVPILLPNFNKMEQGFEL